MMSSSGGIMNFNATNNRIKSMKLNGGLSHANNESLNSKV
jgi:hypothetical protein